MIDPIYSFERLCASSLDIQYGEYGLLTDEQRAVVLKDFVQACRDEQDLTVLEYRRRIGAGNLAAYADTLRVI